MGATRHIANGANPSRSLHRATGGCKTCAVTLQERPMGATWHIANGDNPSCSLHRATGGCKTCAVTRWRHL